MNDLQAVVLTCMGHSRLRLDLAGKRDEIMTSSALAEARTEAHKFKTHEAGDNAVSVSRFESLQFLRQRGD